MNDASRFAEAVVELQAATKIDGASFDAWKQLGLALQKSGDLEGAVKAYRRAGELNAKDPEIWNSLGIVP